MFAAENADETNHYPLRGATGPLEPSHPRFLMRTSVSEHTAILRGARRFAVMGETDMAAQVYAHPAIAAGLAGGIGLMAPAAAYMATASLPDAHAIVQAGGMPFAIGAVAGAGMCAVAVAVLHGMAALGAAAEDAGASSAHEARAAEGAVERSAGSRFFAGGHTPKDIPIITPARSPLSEAEAWADIDELLRDDSPISCDPARSKDICQIALEELQRVSGPAAGAAAVAAAATAPPTEAAPFTAAADSTAVFMAAAGAASSTVNLAAEREPLSDTDAARRAAVSSLDVLSDAVLDLDEPVMAEVEASASAALAPSVPVVDYTGHEDMWAAALAILAEEPLQSTEDVMAAAPRVRHEAVAPESERAMAMAEGQRETEMHGHVNEILGEELSRVPSSSMRRTSREYLRVIQGGTMSMPRLQQAEA